MRNVGWVGLYTDSQKDRDRVRERKIAMKVTLGYVHASDDIGR